MLPDYLRSILERVAKNEGLLEYTIDTNAGSSHGDNFLGIMVAVTLIGTKSENGSVQKSHLHLLCKIPPSNEVRQENCNSKNIFDREIYMYSTLLPNFVRFQHGKGLSEADSFASFPKVYACEIDSVRKSYILIMEDLRFKNYEMWPKEKIAPLNHMLLVMRELGKFHAISFAMADQRPDEFEQFKRLHDRLGEFLIHGQMSIFVKQSLERAAEVIENPEYRKIVQSFANSFFMAYDDCITAPHSKEFAIITHGDCWNNNFLFKYTDSNKSELDSMCFLDWQISRYCPSVIDLIYYIFTATDAEFRQQHYETLLKTYHFSLSEMIRKLGSDPDKLYTYENLKSQLKKFGKYALVCAPMIIQIMVASAKDIGNMDDYSEMIRNKDSDIVKPDLIGPYDGETKAAYSAKINGLIIDLVKYGYLGIE